MARTRAIRDSGTAELVDGLVAKLAAGVPVFAPADCRDGKRVKLASNNGSSMRISRAATAPSLYTPVADAPILALPNHRFLVGSSNSSGPLAGL